MKGFSVYLLLYSVMQSVKFVPPIQNGRTEDGLLYAFWEFIRDFPCKIKVLFALWVQGYL